MKVKELIEVLQKLNPETEIAIEDAEGETAFWITKYRNTYILNGEDYQVLPDNLAKKIVDQNNILCSTAPVSATRHFTKYPVTSASSIENSPGIDAAMDRWYNGLIDEGYTDIDKMCITEVKPLADNKYEIVIEVQCGIDDILTGYEDHTFKVTAEYDSLTDEVNVEDSDWIEI